MTGSGGEVLRESLAFVQDLEKMAADVAVWTTKRPCSGLHSDLCH